MQTRQIHPKRRPEGLPVRDDFALVSTDLPDLTAGEGPGPHHDPGAATNPCQVAVPTMPAPRGRQCQRACQGARHG